MKSFAIVAIAGAASAAWAPPAYGGAESAVSSSAPAEYSAPAYGQETTSEEAPAYETTTSAEEYAPSSYETTKAETTSAPAYTAPAYGASSSAPVYGCNPAHQYPEGQQCISTDGSLTLVTPTTKAYGTAPSASAPAYSPKPTGSWGGYPSHNGTEGGYGGEHGGDSYITQVVTSFETYCPGPTTLTYDDKTYTVTSATTLTITDCPNGCAVPTPIKSYTPEYTTEVVTEYTTTCPYAGEVTVGPSTYTVTESEVLTITNCPGGCSITKPVPATVVVPSYTTVCPSPEVPTTYVIESSTYEVTAETTITVVAPTTPATYTSVYTQPEQPTTVVVDSSVYSITSATEITYTKPTQAGYTITTPVESLPVWSAPPAAETPYSPAQPEVPAPVPSGGYQSPNGTTPISPEIPQQTGAAAKLMAGSAAMAAVFGAFFL